MSITNAFGKVSFNFAIKLQLIVFCCVLVFHLLVLLQFVPYRIVWGGKLQSKADMYNFELASIIINLFMMCIIAMKAKYIKPILPASVIKISIWIFVLIFSLNTLGNLFAETTLETLIFTPLTLLSAVLCYIIVSEN